MSHRQYGLLVLVCAAAATAGGGAAHLLSCGKAPETEVSLRKQLVNPPGTEDIYRTRHFSQAIRVGNTVWVSGQVGRDENGNMADTIEKQCRLAFQRLEAVLAEAGGSLTDVVELVTFHTSMEDFPVFRQVKSEFFTEQYPAWTAVGVSELALPEFLVEIKATAVIGSGSSN